MKHLRMAIMLVTTLFLSACIGEEYDFTPPTLTLIDSAGIEQRELAEANIDWSSDQEYTKETEDIFLLAKEQEVWYLGSGEQAQIVFDSQDFIIESLNAHLWQNDTQTPLQANESEITFSAEEGEYVLVIDLVTDSGSAQYVGNIVIN